MEKMWKLLNEMSPRTFLLISPALIISYITGMSTIGAVTAMAFKWIGHPIKLIGPFDYFATGCTLFAALYYVSELVCAGADMIYKIKRE